ncbi:EamA-like transporter family protein [Roseovarius litorisediminis]|uniref:EamA-like transporter family protein n=1 Tax=Roseovarius litorisediminis TaxID=1312363 RepID=A0A1Y5RBF7_9RHOB|nr:DMT family transporter [Roseovarius litorisediminis]SLN13174.1 EamA-like transporter family protein [Roseovarius litorisediminis]
MKRGVFTAPVVAGVALVGFYTLLISGADAITKMIAQGYAAPQLFALSGGLVAVFCLLLNRRSGHGMRTRCPGAMAIRAGATVAGTVAFFYAFYLLPFADVFLFIALIPIFAALMSGPLLDEPLRRQAWAALALGTVGVMCLFPGGFGSVGLGHLVALAAAFFGTVSMVASRYIGMRDNNLLAQVFYPNLALMGVMALTLPFVFRPMGLADLGLVLAYAILLFGARWVLVAALQILPAYVVTPLVNLQFLWMVVIGAVVFGEAPDAFVYVGAGIVILAGVWLIYDQAKQQHEPVRCVPAKAVPAE